MVPIQSLIPAIDFSNMQTPDMTKWCNPGYQCPYPKDDHRIDLSENFSPSSRIYRKTAYTNVPTIALYTWQAFQIPILFKISINLIIYILASSTTDCILCSKVQVLCLSGTALEYSFCIMAICCIKRPRSYTLLLLLNASYLLPMHLSLCIASWVRHIAQMGILAEQAYIWHILLFILFSDFVAVWSFWSVAEMRITLFVYLLTDPV